MRMKDAIMKRRSVRAYSGAQLTADEKQKINDYLAKKENLVGLLGNAIKMELVESSNTTTGKIGTYGKITDAPAFLVTKLYNTKDELLDLGYVFENLVLFVESIGLHTCWLGGTFDRAALSATIELEEGELIPIISPVGKAKDSVALQEQVAAHTGTRKDFDTLFFSGDFNTPISSVEKREQLEYVRLAPSGVNLQPWRLVLDAAGTMHFYIVRNPEVESYGLPYDIQWVDMGIALSHYVIASGKKRAFVAQPDIALPSSISEYVISVKG